MKEQLILAVIAVFVVAILVGRMLVEYYTQRHLRYLNDIRELLRYQISLSGAPLPLTEDEQELVRRLREFDTDFSSEIEKHKKASLFLHPELLAAIDEQAARRLKS